MGTCSRTPAGLPRAAAQASPSSAAGGAFPVFHLDRAFGLEMGLGGLHLINYLLQANTGEKTNENSRK